MAEWNRLYPSLKEWHNTLVVDSLTALSEHIMEDIMAKHTKKHVTKKLGSKPNTKVKQLPDGVYTCNIERIVDQGNGTVRMRIKNIEPQRASPTSFVRSSGFSEVTAPAWLKDGQKAPKETLRQQVERLTKELNESREINQRCSNEMLCMSSRLQEWQGLCNHLSISVKNLSEKVNS